MTRVVALDAIAKSFGPIRVLHGVSLALEFGKVYGVIGENGAGKSTLMKILAGYEAPSEGSVLVDGRAVLLSGPRDAEALGIVMIHQEFISRLLTTSSLATRSGAVGSSTRKRCTGRLRLFCARSG
jgi:ABC-type sugar transport system ATPase subunit